MTKINKALSGTNSHLISLKILFQDNALIGT